MAQELIEIAKAAGGAELIAAAAPHPRNAGVER
jgi:hypothetical protein